MAPFKGAPQDFSARRSSSEETPPEAITGIETALAQSAVAAALPTFSAEPPRPPAAMDEVNAPAYKHLTN